MNLLQYRYFLIVEKHRSISKAAEELFITQPALSKQIRQFEQRIGAMLFDRKNSFELTEAGKIVKKYAEKIFADIDEMNATLAYLKSNTENNIILNVHSASKIIFELIDEFISKHPAVSFQLIQNEYPDNANLTVFSTDKILKDSNENILLLSERIKVALPASHPLTEKKEITLSDLDNEPFIFLTKDSNLRNIIDNILYSKRFISKIVFESNNPQVVQAMIEKGIGLSFIPECSWKLTTSNIELRDISGETMIRNIYLQINNPNSCTKLERKFIEFLVANFSCIK